MPGTAINARASRVIHLSIMNTPDQPAFAVPHRSSFVLGLRSLLVVAAAFFALAARAQTAAPPQWLTLDDAAFARLYAQNALGSDLTQQSNVAWMLFARVNQPKSFSGGTATTWELWPSNEDTFSPAVSAFVATNKIRSRPHLQPSKAHLLVARTQALQSLAVPVGGGEEVTRNPISYGYIVANKLTTAASAWKRLSTGPNLNFPNGAVEIKADWQNGSLPGAYTNTDSDGNVYSLVGLHIMMKFAPTPADPFGSNAPSWFWTTFEFKGNPGLANAQSFLTYHDALSRDQSLALLNQAGLGQGAFANYVCNGTQIQYTDTKNPAIRLGNTTMENFAFTPANATSPAQWKSWNVSCHTCHGSGSAKGIGNNGGPGNLTVNPYFFNNIAAVIGPLPKNIADGGYKSFDFVWSLWQAQ